MSQNLIKTISGTCGGRGSWISNALSNAGPGSGSIKSLFPYNSSSTSPSLISLAFPGILQNGGGKGRRKKARRTRRRTNKKRGRTTRYKH